MPPHSALDRAHALDVELYLNDTGLKASVDAVALPVAVAVAVPIAMPVVTTKRNVHFADADVIEFEPTVWTSTVSSDGAPVGLSNKVRRRTRRRLDSYEDDRACWRVLREEYMEHGYLEPDERLDILEAAGHAMATVHHVEHDTIRINRERWESNEHDLRYQYGLGEMVDLNAIEYDDEDLELDLDQDQDQDQDQELELELEDDDCDNRFFRTEFVFDDVEDDAVDFDDDEDEEMLEEEDDEEQHRDERQQHEQAHEDDTESLHRCFYGQPTLLEDDEDDMRLAMDAMDSYDARKFDEWAWDYSTEAMISDTHDEGEDDREDNVAHSGSLVDESPLARCHEADDTASVPYPEDLFDLHDLDHDIQLTTDEDEDDGDFADMSTSPSDVTTFEMPLLKLKPSKSDASVNKPNVATTASANPMSSLSLPPYAIV